MSKPTFTKSRSSYIQSTVLPIRESLIRSVLVSEPPKEKPPKKEQLFNGPRGYTRRSSKPPAIPDEVIIAIRAMREQHGATPKQLMEIFNLTRNQIEAIIQYRYRSHLVPQQQP